MPMTTKRAKVCNPEMGWRGRVRRDELGIPMKELALKMGVVSQRMSQIELDGVECLGTIRRWAAALDMDPVYLAFGPRKKRSKR
jgi:transcriptional regulator with XRE-family HTH domain